MLPAARSKSLSGLMAALLLAFVSVLGCDTARAAEPLEIHIGVITHKAPPPALYELDPTPEDEAAAGAGLAIDDNNTTGRFSGQRYVLDQAVLDKGQSPVEAAVKLADGGAKYLVVALPADELLAVADALKGRPVLVFNAAAQDDRLRGADCRANVFHVPPSRAMVTDALVQYLATKRWMKLFLTYGPTEADKLYADALRQSAKKFGLTLAAEKAWTFGPLARARSDSITQSDALVFSRGTDYDIMVVADEEADFGDYLAYRTWDPKVIAGTQGLIAASWHRAQDAWGSAQLQSRFFKRAKRTMRPIDYQAWVAVRAVGEAATRTKSADPATISTFLVDPKFQLAAFKGVPVNFRGWDHQLRQPVLIAQPMAIVSVSPQPGYLHQRSVLDTLGVDQPESQCHLP
ncbi:ABC transporter substrate-binding protein [Labrys sp. KB_33_2]|uniref:ABC transporter substrate-binding protein n=1 Tax=Labrys sp. KB_33_2 TaxID=3237479 RepID=UPI003F90B799